ncbi:unnamed protein product, partial [Rotaria sp. Silwood1]
ENYLNKICRISNPETNECVSNTFFFQTFQGPLSRQYSSAYLISILYGEVLAIINRTSLQIEFIGPFNLAATVNSHYNSDETGIYWIGNDDHLRKVNFNGVNLLDVDINSGANQYYAFHRKQNTIFGNEMNHMKVKTSSTHPVIDNKTAQITSQDEINKYDLVTSCVSLNSETIRITMDDVLSRINIEVPSESTIFIQCPMFVENQMIYLPWYFGSATDVLPLNVIGIPQIAV